MPAGSSRALLLRDAEQVLTLAGPAIPRRGQDLSQLGIVRAGSALILGEKTLRVGPTRELEAEARRCRARVLDCRGRVVMPGFVDSHAHLVFASSRADDFEQQIAGESHEEIAQAGGGIRLSARLLRQATVAGLVSRAERFLEHFAAHGSTAVEVKSGYGLDVESEIKILEVVRRLRKSSPVELVPTVLAAHALPPEYRKRQGAYIQLMARHLIPAVACRKLAEFVDCFCDREAFTVDECRRLSKAGLRCGLIPRLHAEQLAHTDATQLAVEMGAASADHLDQIGADDVKALARSNVVATLLPGSNFHLGLDCYPPARQLIDAGAVVALATDFNPGTGPTLSMQFILALACSQMRMTPAEAISAATINGAYSLGHADRLGSIEPGKEADLIVMDVDDYRKISYYFAWNHCVMTIKRGL